jgi:membrane protein
MSSAQNLPQSHSLGLNRGKPPSSWAIGNGGLSSAWQVLKQAASDWVEDKATQQGASLAFYSMLSLAPLIMISLAVASLFFDTKMVDHHFFGQIEAMVGREGAEAIHGILTNAKQPTTGSLAASLGIVTLLFGASGVFGQLQEAMNTIWDVKPKPNAGIWGVIRSRFLSFTMVLGTAFLLLVSLLLSTVIGALTQHAGTLWPQTEAFIHLANEVTTFLVMTLLFAMMFKLLPDTPVAWRDVWVGAVLTAVLFTLGKLLIGLYLGKSAIGSAYGAAGSLVVLLVWIYYSAQVLIFGGELAHVLAKRRTGEVQAGQGG